MNKLKIVSSKLVPVILTKEIIMKKKLSHNQRKRTKTGLASFPVPQER